MSSEKLYRVRLKGTELFYGTKKGRFGGEVTHFSKTGKFYSGSFLKLPSSHLHISDAQAKKHPHLECFKGEGSWNEKHHFVHAMYLEVVQYDVNEAKCISREEWNA